MVSDPVFARCNKKIESGPFSRCNKKIEPGPFSLHSHTGHFIPPALTFGEKR